MRKLFTLLNAMLLAVSAFAATEAAWYNDVTSITNNGQYYIYSVKGAGFMQAGQSRVKAVNQNNYTSNSDLLFTINTSSNRTYCGSNYLCSYEMQTCGPVGGNNTSGSTMIWENKSSYWLVYGSYTFIWAQKAYLWYADNKYDATCLNPDLSDAKFHWYLISPAQYDRHWAIYLYDRYKETISDYTQWKDIVPSAYYTALENAYAVTFDVKNAEHSKEAVNAHRADLKALYEGAAALVTPYADAKAAIAALENIEDKGEGDLTKINNDLANAKTALEQAMTVDAINAAIAHLKGIDPITFTVTEFTALESIGTPAASEHGRTLTFEAENKAIINANGVALYKGTTKLIATAAETDAYYAFVRSTNVTVHPIDNTGNAELVGCEGETLVYGEDSFTASTTKQYTLENRTGGDSVLTLTVTINPVYALNEEKTITYGDAETWHGQDLSEKTVGKHTLNADYKTIHGCDSTFTLTLTVNKQETLDVPVEIAFCEGGSETYRGVEYTEAGLYPVPATGDVRDTVYNVTVTVLKPSSSNEEKTIVYGTAEEWNGYDLSEYAVGTYQLNYKTENAAGCDSLVTLALTVNKQETLNVPVELAFCEGSSEEYRGVVYSEAGTFEVPAEGTTRDTLYVVNVTVNPVYSFNENGTAKVGEGFEWQGKTIQTPATGTFNYDTAFTTVNGCDSIYYLTLTVTKADVVEETVELAFCEGGSEEYRGVVYTVAGEYPVYVEGELRDTVYTVKVTVNQPSATNEEMTIVYGTEGEWNGYDLSQQAVGTRELVYRTTNVFGCDSIVTLALTVNKLETLELEPVLFGFCPDDSVEYRGKWYTESVEDTLLVEGEIRDTLIYVTAVVLPTSYEVLYDTVNAGEIILLPEGEWTIGETVVSGEYATTEADMPELVFVQLDKTDDGCVARIDLIVTVEPRNTEGVEAVSAGEKAQKFFHNGVIYFRRGEHIYTTDGKVVE